MAADKNIMGDSGPLILVVLSSLGAVIGIILGVMLCSWCFGSKKDDDDDDEEKEDVLSRKYKPVALNDETGQGDIRTLNKRSWEDKGIPKKSPVVTHNTIKFERPERSVVTEHVQPLPTTPATLNDSLGMRRDQYTTYQTMASPQKFNNQGSEDDNSSVWKGMRSIATRLMEDVEETKTEAATAITVEGVDYNLGKIQYALSYDFQNLTLTLKILQATGLPAKDSTGTSDPYVKILFLPDKRHKLLTKVKKKNLSPRWNECFLFEGWPHNKLLEKTVYLQVIDYDRFSRDDPIGEAYAPLNEVDLSQSPVIWKYLAPCKDSRGKLGEVLLSLSYQPNVGRLSVIVIKAKDLKIKDITGSSDPYVKLWLAYGTNRVEKKKTTVKMRTLCPVFNESFIFDIPWDKIREASIDVIVMDYDKIGRNELIGRISLGSRSGPLETRHWNDMITKPRQQVAQWHLLKD